MRYLSIILLFLLFLFINSIVYSQNIKVDTYILVNSTQIKISDIIDIYLDYPYILVFNITNIGSYEIRDIYLNFSKTRKIFESNPKDSIYIGNLLPGQSKNVSLTIYPLSTGISELNVYIYSGSNSIYGKSYSIVIRKYDIYEIIPISENINYFFLLILILFILLFRI